MLEDAGYLVIEAPNGQEGIRQFRQMPTMLFIMDMFGSRIRSTGV